MQDTWRSVALSGGVFIVGAEDVQCGEPLPLASARWKVVLGEVCILFCRIPYSYGFSSVTAQPIEKYGLCFRSITPQSVSPAISPRKSSVTRTERHQRLARLPCDTVHGSNKSRSTNPAHKTIHT